MPPGHREGKQRKDGGGPAAQSSGSPQTAPRRNAAAASLDSSQRIALAAVAGAHGVKGELRLKLFTDSIDKLKQYGDLYLNGVPSRLIEVRHSGQVPIARFDAVADRGAAEALRGVLLEVDRSSLPPLEEDEYYHADLIGLSAVDKDETPIGTVVSVENYGAGDLLEIEDQSGRRSLVPFRAGIADLKDGQIVLDREFLA
jgi:16S rRNA processing protein RimM